MTDRELHKQLKQNHVASQYVLIGEESLLIENATGAIKKSLKVDEAFDSESCSISETSLDDFAAKLFTMPFASKRRLIIARNLEELDKHETARFAETVNTAPAHNCLIMTYRLDRNEKRKSSILKDIGDLLPRAQCVVFESNRQRIHNWIRTKNERDNLQLSSSIMRYLEEEFQNDITGLKNEFEKIENYLSEAEDLDAKGIKTLAQGLCNFNRYAVVDAYMKGNRNALLLFEELRPYLNGCARIVDAFTRSILSRSRRLNSAHAKEMINATIRDITDIDHAVKRGSQFDYTMLELLLLKGNRITKKGANDGG